MMNLLRFMMQSRLQRGLLLSAVLFVLFGGTFCPVAFGAAGGTGDGVFLVEPGLLRHAGLEMGWQINLPIKSSEKVDRMYVFGGFVYVLTDSNYIFCIDRVKGSVRFGLQLAAKGLPIYPPQHYDDKLLFVIGNRLSILNPAVGAITDSRQIGVMGRSAACAAVRNSEHIFIAGAQRKLHAIVVGEYWQRFQATADDNSLITSVVADEKLVAFATDSGSVVIISSQGPVKRGQFDAGGAISAPLVRDRRWLYVSAENTKLYKLDMRTGRSGWQEDFQTGASLTESAIVGKMVVYQYAGPEGLYAIDKDSGEQIWHEKGAHSLLSEDGGLANVFARPGKLMVMDNISGKELFSVNLAAVTHHAVNTADENMYLSDDAGRVMNLRLGQKARSRE